MVLSENTFPVLNGLVLIGGRSQRMGSPKEKIQWYGKEQSYYVADLLGAYCDTVYISCRADQAAKMRDKTEREPTYKFLSDAYANSGPLGGILTAFDLRSDRAWLVLACDLPLIDSTAIHHLIQRRDPQKIATAYRNPQDSLPEPLCTIWEPNSYVVLKQLVTENRLSPRRALIQQEIALIDSPDAGMLANINTAAEAAHAKMVIASKSQDR